MSVRAIFTSLLAALLCLPLLGCDDGGTISGGMPLESAGKRLLQLRTVAQLLPNRRTHVAVNRVGHLFWVQETEDGHDVLFMQGETGIPRATRLGTSNILDALRDAGDSAGDGPISGNIRDIVAAEGGLYFYFFGYRGKTPKACLGQYLPQSGRIRVLADTARLFELTQMGQSLDLARASLVASGDRVYLWLRHSDASVFIAFDPRFIPALTPPKFESPLARIHSEGRPLPLTKNEYELSPGPGGTLFLLDIASAVLWQVDRSGAATVRFLLIGLPKQLAPPTAVGENSLVMFAAESELIGTELQILERPDLPKFQYPALLQIRGNQISAIERTEFRAHAGFPVYAVRLGRLIPETPQTWISYDAASGALMRVRVEEN
jgi:hypothetical protein